MISTRIFIPVCLMGAAALALAQTPPPAPPAPPAPPQAQATPAPAPPAPPASPGMHRLLDRADGIDPADIADRVNKSLRDLNLDVNVDLDLDMIREQAEIAREKAENAIEKDQFNWDFSGIAEDAMAAARDKMAQVRDQLPGMLKGFAFAQTPVAPMPPMPPMPAPAPKVQAFMRGRNGSVDSLYQRGLSALDNHRYDQALDDFTEVVTRGGNHVDGALYWKAYTLNKLGRRDDATAAIAELRKSYASSRWLDDAKALEIEVKQSSGQKVSRRASRTTSSNCWL